MSTMLAAITVRKSRSRATARKPVPLASVALVADMAPAHLLGRYLSVFGLSFTISLALGPAIGGLLLQTAPDAVWWGGALAAVLAGAVLFGFGDRIPDPLLETQPRLVSAAEAE